MNVEELHPEATKIVEKYKKLKLFNSCIFTGEEVKKRRGEHVIPKWMIKEYSLHQGRMEMAQNDKFSNITEFRAPAKKEANSKFGEIENKIKHNTASKEELLLWGMKVSLGIMINHHRMSLNINHPHSPEPLDNRGLRGALMSFHKDYKKWSKDGSISLNGDSVTEVKTAYESLLFLHLFGGLEKDSLSPDHDLIAPYGLVVVARNNTLTIISMGGSLENKKRVDFINEWKSRGMEKSRNLDEIRCFIAVCYFETVFYEAFHSMYDRPPSIAELKLIAYQLGIIIIEEPDGLKYTSRNNPKYSNTKIFNTLIQLT
jgi:hypothetical protein